jgi:GntR family transcriptional regulator, gluconate operon transcriptional repressor
MVSASSLEMVQVEPLWERVAATMRRAIVLGELAPGDRLKEPFLAERFGVSRLPIREAITQLEREGLVRSEPRRGAYVVGVTEQDIADIYECRLTLETLAIQRAAGRITPEAAADLYRDIEQMGEEVAAGRMGAFATADMAFHRALIAISANRAVRSAWEPLAPLIETTLGIADASVADIAAAVSGHRPIVQALERHDAATAVALLHEHLTTGQSITMGAIAGRPIAPPKRKAAGRKDGAKGLHAGALPDGRATPSLQQA